MVDDRPWIYPEIAEIGRRRIALKKVSSSVTSDFALRADGRRDMAQEHFIVV